MQHAIEETRTRPNTSQTIHHSCELLFFVDTCGRSVHVEKCSGLHNNTRVDNQKIRTHRKRVLLGVYQFFLVVFFLEISGLHMFSKIMLSSTTVRRKPGKVAMPFLVTHQGPRQVWMRSRCLWAGQRLGFVSRRQFQTRSIEANIPREDKEEVVHQHRAFPSEKCINDNRVRNRDFMHIVVNVQV